MKTTVCVSALTQTDNVTASIIAEIDLRRNILKKGNFGKLAEDFLFLHTSFIALTSSAMHYCYPVQLADHQSINIRNAEPSEYSSPDYVVEKIVLGEILEPIWRPTRN